MSALRSDWREIGGLGRFALLGIALAAIVTVLLGFSITSTVRGQLLNARAALVQTAVADLPEFPLDRPPTVTELARFDVEIRRRVLSTETVRVKLWIPNGTIIYSSTDGIAGSRFPLSPAAREAFTGDTGTAISNLGDAAHAIDRDKGDLIEYYVPLTRSNGAVTSVIEVEQDIATFNAAIARITRNVWISIVVGLLILGTFMAALTAARARELNHRRRQAERLLKSAFAAQEEERRRVVGSLHDHIGQPLYRLLYGLEGARIRLGDDSVIADDLKVLQDIARDVDKTLRRELRLLHQGLAEDAGLQMALTDLVDLTERETELKVNATIDLPTEPTAVQRTALYQAVQEAVTNVRKHAAASTITIQIHEERRCVLLEVRDDGVGLHGAPGLGITTTRERFEALGGSVHVAQVDHRGTSFRAWLPIETGAET